MRISFKRSGGFAGLTGQSQSVEINLDELPEDKAQTLRRLIEEAHLFDQAPQSQAANKLRDGFQYDLTVEDDNRTHSVRTSDGAVPEELQPLIQWLSKEVTEQLKKRR